MKVAIYSRKSKFTGKGESVENQIQMCREHAIQFMHCSDEDFVVYEDEGFSGGNTDRPQFQQMLKDAKLKRFEAIICYRLDRISRNVSDFSQLINELEKLGVSFVSVREQFDTTKPMGRAMMYIASVFSQLERETITERIRDNMLQLSKTGRWLGGTTPTGYRSEMVLSREANGREVKSYKLVVVPEEAQLVQLIFEKYVALRSITQVEKYLAEKCITTKNGSLFGRFSIKFILSNPVYAIADEKLYKHLKSNNYDVYSEKAEFNGSSGLMGYNKTRQNCSSSGERYRKSDEWILAVGLHNGIVASEVWIKAQELLERNKSKAYRKVKSTSALLSGIIRCAGCGSFMRPKTGRRLNSDGQPVFYYICELKEKSRKSRCDMPNANGNVVDGLALSEINNLFLKYPPLIDDRDLSEMKTWFNRDILKDEIHLLEEKLFNIDYEIKNLVRILSKNANSGIETAIMVQMKKLNDQKQTYLAGLEKLLLLKTESTSIVEASEACISKIFPPDKIKWEEIGMEAKRRILRNIFKRLEWNGRDFEIYLTNLFP
ncbi:MAG: site-specific recombinase, invertase Pin [Eubacterium sp.]|jgi:site-specific DNA recombinase|nr:site-specific recombinase, invertase Pin [Eubacterium sp.]